MSSNLIAIVGRPNVGKSTLFNRLIERRQAIMDDQSGVTRDRHYGRGQWGGIFFTVIDTGGYVVGSEDVFESAIRDQVEIALEEADLLLFMVDTQVGLTDLDNEFAHVLRRTKKPVLLVANKADTPSHTHEAAEFYSMGFDELFPVSSQTGTGTGDLLDRVIELLPSKGVENPQGDLPRVTIIGRPNVGKSSFVNLLLGKERTVVADIAGTTRDAIDSHYKAFGKEFILTDTAGLRRKSRVHENVEFYSVMRAIRTVEEADVCIVLLDATQGLESQDLNILRLAEVRHKGLVLMVNKWDLVEKDTHTAPRWEKELRERLGTMGHVPIIFSSVLTKQRVFRVVETAIQVFENRGQRISTSKLNDVILPAIERNPPPAYKSKYVRIKYATQLPIAYPTFAFFCNHPQYIRKSYERFLENQLREHFPLEGVPIKIVFRKK